MHHVITLDDSTPAGCTLSLYLPLRYSHIFKQRCAGFQLDQREVHYHSFTPLVFPQDEVCIILSGFLHEVLFWQWICILVI